MIKEQKLKVKIVKIMKFIRSKQEEMWFRFRNKTNKNKILIINS